MGVSPEDVKRMREMTGLPVLECKKALEEAGGDIQRAVEVARTKGMLKAGTKLAQRATAEGRIGSYIHSTGKLGVLVELQCETDFVARSDDFQALLKDLCIHVAGSGSPPDFVSREQVPASVVERERSLVAAQHQKKPPAVVEKILAGNIEKFYERVCLLDQPFVKDDTKRVKELIQERMAKLGENIRVARFARFEVGKTG